MEIKFRKCSICGKIVWSFNNIDVICCNNTMKELIPNSIDASFEKHVPTYEISVDKIIIKVNHVMEENHYIRWIIMVTDTEVFCKEFKPFEEPIAVFDYKGKCEIYSYCNLHGLWVNNVE